MNKKQWPGAQAVRGLLNLWAKLIGRSPKFSVDDYVLVHVEGGELPALVNDNVGYFKGSGGVMEWHYDVVTEKGTFDRHRLVSETYSRTVPESSIKLDNRPKGGE